MEVKRKHTIVMCTIFLGIILSASFVHSWVSSECTVNGGSVGASSYLDEALIFSRECISDQSTITLSTLNGTVAIDSTIHGSYFNDTYIDNSVLADMGGYFSTIEDTTFSCGNLTILGTVSNGVLSNGKILSQLGYTYHSPFSTDAICSGVLPISGIHTANPEVVTNGSDVILNFVSFGAGDYIVLANVTEFNSSGTIQLRDDGVYPDESEDDGTYSAIISSLNETDTSSVVVAFVNDTVGNIIPFNATIVFDNTDPSISLSINNGANETSTRSVELAQSYFDLNGIFGCRFSNYDLASLKMRCDFEDSFVCEDGQSPLGNPLRNFTSGVSGEGYSHDDSAFYDLYYANNGHFSKSTGTVSFWFAEGSGMGAGANILFWINNSAGEYFRVYHIAPSAQYHFEWSDGSIIHAINATCTTCTANVWNHFAVTFTESVPGSHSASFYINGGLINSTSSGVGYPSGTMDSIVINSHGSSLDRIIDEFMIFNYSKSSNEILEDFSQPAKYVFDVCTGTESWLLTNSTGDKTVYFQVQDVAGNINSTSSQIALTQFGDSSPPQDLSVVDDGAYTSDTSQLRGRWIAYDFQSTVFYRYRVWNETTAITDWTSADDFARSTFATVTGLMLEHNSTYRFEVTAYNANDLETSGFSNGITIDTVAPTTPFINSSTHPEATWSSASDVTVTMNATDALSGVSGYSYVLDASSSTTPDVVAEVSFASTDTYWNWTNNPGSVGDYLRDVATDSNNNIYVAGGAYASLSDSSFFIAKLNSSGGNEWNWTYNMSDGYEEFYAIDVDSNKNVYAVGNDEENTDMQFHVVKLNSTGSLLWNWTWDVSGGDDRLFGIDVATDGSIVVAGGDDTGGDLQFKIVKLASNGSHEWNYTYDYSAGADVLYGVQTDSSGNIYAAGYDTYPGNSQMHIISLDGDGNFRWNWTDNPSSGSDLFFGMTLDANANVIAAGHDTALGNTQFHLVKLDSDGNFLWNHTNNPSTFDSFTDVAVDTNDQIVAVGTDTIAGNLGHYYLKLDAEGSVIWNKTINPSSGGDQMQGVATDSNDNLIAVGYENSPGDLQHYTIKLSSFGDSEFHSEETVTFGSISDGRYYVHARALDDAGNWGDPTHYSVLLDASGPSTPQFLSYTSTQNTANLSLIWTPAVDKVSGVVGYHVRVDNNSDFSSPEYEQYVGNVTFKSIGMSANGTWYASVRAVNNASVNSTWSNQVSKIIDQVPPTVTITSPANDGDTTVSHVPLFIASTNEAATCTYTLPPSPIEYTVSYTGTFYHENQHLINLDNGAHNVQFECTDAVGNVGTSASRPFTIDDTKTVNAATWVGVSPAYAGVITNATVLVEDSIPVGLSGLDTSLFSVFIDGALQNDVGIYDRGAGNYEIVFRAPELPGSYNLVVTVSGVSSSTYALLVSELKFYVEVFGNLGSLSKRNYVVYGESDTAVIGLATETDKDQSNRTTAPLSVGTRVSDNAYLFIAAANAEPDKKENFLEDEALLDQPIPAFSSKNEPDEYTIVTTLKYPWVTFNRNQEVSAGKYQLAIRYNGVYQTGPNAGDINMSATLT